MGIRHYIINSTVFSICLQIIPKWKKEETGEGLNSKDERSYLLYLVSLPKNILNLPSKS